MIRKLAFRAREYLLSPILHRSRYDAWPLPTTADQKMLSLLYRQHDNARHSRLTFQDVGFRVHSQHEEDGILLYIFSLIGTTNKRCVEICAGDGIECNTANLIVNHRWVGLLCDGKDSNVARAREFYSWHPDTKYWPPIIVKEWITKSNVNSIILANGFFGDIDLLSLDVDGIDYWLWDGLTCIKPRVIVLEFNHLWGPDASVTVPYRDDFVAEFTQYGSDYAGASLMAFVKAGRKKNYRLVGTNAIATNAFFIHNDIRCDALPEIETTKCFDHPRAQFGMQHRLPKVKNKEWLEV
jgi:hypothetical protein